MLANVAGADRAEQRVGDRVREDVGVRVSLQSARVRDLDAAQYQFQSIGETMDVVTDAGPNHAHSLTKHRTVKAASSRRTPKRAARAKCLPFITVSNRSDRLTRRCCICLSYSLADEDQQLHRRFQPGANPRRCPTS